MPLPQELTSTRGGRETFFPTPEALAAKMLGKVDWATVENVLEPSAGKGDLAIACADKLRAYRGYWRDDSDNRSRIDCIEIDPNLRAILKEKEFRVIHDDFLTFSTYKNYDLILMNPPFDRGAEHLLKAIRIAEGCGSQIVCILNAETIRNPYSFARQQLQQAIQAYEGTVTECDKAFATAERKTSVEAVIVSLTVPAPERHSSIMDDMRRDAERKKEEEPESPYSALIKGDFIEAFVDRFNYELSCGVKLINEWHALKPILMSKLTEDKYDHPILELKMDSEIHRGGSDAVVNSYLRKTRKKYWSALFQQKQFVSQLTTNLQEELRSRVDEFADYDFSYFNIYTLAQNMLAQVNSGIESTIMQLFDDWTKKFHWDENSQNRHYFTGWRTNDAFAVNHKVIIPLNAYSWYDKNRIDDYRVIEKIGDIEKVFDFLDGGRSIGIDYASALREAIGASITKDIQCRYFKVTFFKKGTCHIVFTNRDVLHKFNLFAARGKNWLPPAYGKKRYKDMTQEEKAVIDSFEGEASYTDVMAHSDYFLQTSQPLMLGSGE